MPRGRRRDDSHPDVCKFVNEGVNLISRFRWRFHGVSDVPIGYRVAAIPDFLAAGMLLVRWMIPGGHRLKR
jgi:hypothetical protein